MLSIKMEGLCDTADWSAELPYKKYMKENKI